MLKIAFEMGVKIAFGEEGLTEDQMSAARHLSGVGGGVLGATGGGLLGKYLGGQIAETFGDKTLFGNPNEKSVERGQLLGSLVGSVGGGALGGYAGSQVPKWLSRKAAKPKAQPKADQSESESSLGLLPEIYGMMPDMRMNAMPEMEGFYPEY